MKLSIIALSTLAISAQAWLLPNGPLPNGPGVTYANDDHKYPNHHVYEHHSQPHPPCHDAHRKSAIGAVKAWMAAYGLISPPRSHTHTGMRLAGPDDIHPFSRPHKIDWIAHPDLMDFKGLSDEQVKEKLAHMMYGGVEGWDYVPVQRGGTVKIMMKDGTVVGKQVPDEGMHPGGGLHGHAGWHHRRPNSFSGRLNRAMRNLRPAESLALAFVLGAGLGSILHMIFMLTLLLSRRIRCGRLTKEERQARRQARRQRRADKKAGREGGVRLDGEDEAICVLRAPELEEGLPRYEDGEVRVEGDGKATNEVWFRP